MSRFSAVRSQPALAIGLMLALYPGVGAAGSTWGSPLYGDPPAWCTNYSDMWTATVVTNDPHVGTNPEQNTFYGFHPNPGYDDWYGYFYGDFRGSPGDASGWTKLLHETYPNHYHWNYASNGWAVHGHVKQYIAYYNWTFGGQCGMGRYGSGSPLPYMADQFGYPVVDIYVDSTPPYPPRPRLTDMTTSSVTFTWDPVADQGDGAGADYFASGLDHYQSWLTLNNDPNRLQLASTTSPRALTQVNMSNDDTACVHVMAIDKLQNSTPDQITCATALAPPPMPPWGALQSQVAANPTPLGLVGLDSWFWLDPTPVAVTVTEIYRGIQYAVTATPNGADWEFGDGQRSRYEGDAGFGRAYPQASGVTHTYQAHTEAGYAVQSSVRYTVTWTAEVDGRVIGPYLLAAMSLPARPLDYAVQQAQPELIQV